MSRLKKAPLQEVIFEVRWEPDVNPENRQLYDKDFELALGAFGTIVKGKFPVYKRKANIPIEYSMYQANNQFWRNESEWPVLQLGPCIFTLNETDKTYDWQNNFYGLIQEGLNDLEKAYGKNLSYNFVTLRYIDSVKIKDFGYEKIDEFVNGCLNFKFQNSFNTLGPLKELQFDQVFNLDNGSGLHIAFSNGKDKDQNTIFFWQTAVNNNSIFTKEEVIKWCDEAHTISSSIFKQITKKEFYERFI